MKRDPGDRSIYRRYAAAPDLVSSRISIKETDLLVFAARDLGAEVREAVITERYQLEQYLSSRPEFAASLVPLAPAPGAPAIVRRMAEAGSAAGVGPMAAVAGAVCDGVAARVGGLSADLIIENGGDLYLATTRERTVGIYTGEAGLDLALGVRVSPERSPVGICTSSGRIGHSLSFGEASSATVIAATASLADAAATAVGNRVRGSSAVEAGLAAARGIPGVLGAVVVAGGRLGVWGEVELVKVGADA